MIRSGSTVWIVLLVVGLAVVARPAARRVRLVHDDLQAVRIWAQARTDPAGNAPGAPCAWLSSPDIGLGVLALAGADAERLHRAPCLDPVAGNTVILGHRDTHFAPLQHVRPGATLTLQDRRSVTTTYTVERTLVLPADEAESFILGQPPESALILVTCHPFGYLGPAPDRFLVVATQRGPYISSMSGSSVPR